MRAVIQRVSHAACQVEGVQTGAITQGLLVLLGVEEDDKEEDAAWLAAKICAMRIFADDQGLMNRSLLDVGGGLLLISQFTLYAQTKKGNRPSFIRAAKPDKAKPLYEDIIKRCSDLLNQQVQTGIFGADMQISLQNDGPVTIIMNTKDKDNF
ncbi:D-aminoacyl-tRNA deacylase [Sphingobacterium sp. lm-10]|uniref:D-aminoacyl-tRNA deacylase n=1 Tax=Sphingobacterium sp. lm-10 TaxID=2944904 RepID=UPI002022781A|nr:D-aminoacyl-tRNA deacylase [Sphingobacterium sp. lm-10]MCL7988496.1 D-aminoacyl-tRNA deacylase [Sphingobacterium sp. lm-10]